MANTEVLLVQPVEGLGGEGDQVKVRAGYARNFLLPRKIAVTLNASNRKHVDSLKKRRAQREQSELDIAQDLAKKLEKTSLAFAVKTGEGGKMFGAITAQDIHEKLTASGVEHETTQQVTAADPADQLLRVAHESNADLIVIGLRPRTPVGKFIMGSSAQTVLLRAECPVLAVKAAAH